MTSNKKQAKEEKERELNQIYREGKRTIEPGSRLEEVFQLIVECGIDNNKDLGALMYPEETSEEKRINNAKGYKRDLFNLLLGEKENKDNYPRIEEFIERVAKNDLELLHPRLEKEYLCGFESENVNTILEQDYSDRPTLKARSDDKEIVRVVYYLDRRCWSDKCLLMVKGSRKAGKTTTAKALAELSERRGVTRVIYYDFKDITNEKVLANPGSFMNYFINKFDEETNSQKKDNNSEYKYNRKIRTEQINDDPCDGSYYYTKKLIESISFDREDNFLLLIIDNVDKLADHIRVATTFYYYLRKIFQGIEKIRIVITYSTECYLKLDDTRSPFNVGERINLCGLDSENIKQLLEINRESLSDEYISDLDINKLLDWMGGNPHLWQTAIHYLQKEQKHEFDLEKFKEKVIDNDNVRLFFIELCQTIEKDKQLVDKIIELQNYNYLEEPIRTKTKYILEGLGVIKKDPEDRNKWLISCGLYEVFMQENFHVKNNSSKNIWINIFNNL